MTFFNKNKIIALVFVLGIIFLFGKAADVRAAYSDEGTAFFAQANPGAYAIEGVAFYAYTSQFEGTVPVYRSLCSQSGNHLFTTSSSEKNTTGYSYEGIAFYAYPNQVDGTVPVYRFYSSSTNDHFYTTSEAEKNALQNNPQWGYASEGPVFYVYPNKVDGTSTVYRFFNAQNGDHFYTASEDEKNSISLSPIYRFLNISNGDHFYTASDAEKDIVANTSKSGYLFEGIAFYAHSTQVNGSVPVYRSYNGSISHHLYTTSSTEKDASGYSYENIAFYAFPNQTNDTSPVYRLYNSSGGDHFYTISDQERNNLLTTDQGSNISVGVWDYSKSDLTGSGSFKIDANKNYKIEDKNGNTLATVDGVSSTKVVYDSGGYFYTSGSMAKTHVKTAVNFEAADGNNSDLIFNVHRPSSNWDRYRGKIKIQYTDSSNIWVVNTLPLEQYVAGAGEFTGTGPAEHTKVMTVIYRTYGFWYIKYATKYNQYGFTIRGDSGSQIYSGYDHENQYSNIPKYAKDTRGSVATYDGDVALTPYCSWSDGHTRSFKEVWGSSDYPWCKSVDDPYGKNSSMSTAQLQAAGNHMVGLIANGSLDRANNGWSFSKIMKYYYTGISLNPVY
jgi:peptidoglycan hydrolase-like amidase